MSSAAVTRPALRWHGGKWKIGSWIASHFPEHRVYVESFGGAGSVLLRKPRSHGEVYNDLNSEVVGLFRVLQDEVKSARLVQLLSVTPYAREEFEKAYEAHEDPVESARRLIIRCYQGFGSNAHSRDYVTGFRSDAKRNGTPPARDWANYPWCLMNVIERFRGVVIENRPAIKVIEQHDGPDTLHYVDPPYLHSTRRPRQLANYGEHEMTDDQHRELADVLHRVKGYVAISGYRSKLYDRLFGDWRMVTRRTFADGANPREECLWLSPNIRSQISLFIENEVPAQARAERNR